MKIIAYTDGSFRQGTKDEKIVGYGVSILVDNDDEEFALNGVSVSEHLLSSRNVSGELLAVMALIDTISGVSENPRDIDLHIYYDYEGVEKWVTGSFKSISFISSSPVKYNLNKAPVMIACLHSLSWSSSSLCG